MTTMAEENHKNYYVLACTYIDTGKCKKAHRSKFSDKRTFLR